MSQEQLGVIGGGEGTTPASSFETPAPAPAAAAVSTPDAGVSTPAAFNFNEFVPQEYRDKPWVKDLERSGDQAKENLFKLIENQQTMLGKRTGAEIPTAESPEEVKQAFRKAMGVPEKAEEYQYTPMDLSNETPEFQELVKSLGEDTTTVNRMKSKAHELGIRPSDFQALASEFDQIRLEELKGAQALAEQNRQVFIEKQNKSFSDLYGDKADIVKATAVEMAKKILPDNVKATGDDTLALFEVLRFVHEKFYKDDVVIPQQASSATGGGSRAAIHEQIMKERAKPEFRDPWHPDNEAQHKKVNEMYDRMMSLPI